jgi:nitrogen regulatory protein P-II 1
MIVAIIRPDKLEAVQAALVPQDINLMTVSDVRGCGTRQGFAEQFRGNKIGLVRLLPKVKLEIAVNEEFVKPAVEAILKAAKSEPSSLDDGKVFVLNLEDCYRFLNGETGSAAIGALRRVLTQGLPNRSGAFPSEPASEIRPNGVGDGPGVPGGRAVAHDPREPLADHWDLRALPVISRVFEDRRGRRF